MSAKIPTALPAVIPTFLPAFTNLADDPPPPTAPYVSCPMKLSKVWPEMVTLFPGFGEYSPVLFRTGQAPKLLGNAKLWVYYGEHFYARFAPGASGDILGCWQVNPDASDRSITSVALTVVIVDFGPDTLPIASIWEWKRAMDKAPRSIVEAQKETLLPQWPKASEANAAAFGAFKDQPWTRVTAQVKVTVKPPRNPQGNPYPESHAVVSTATMAELNRLKTYFSADTTAEELKNIKKALEDRISRFKAKMV